MPPPLFSAKWVKKSETFIRTLRSEVDVKESEEQNKDVEKEYDGVSPN